MNRIFFIQQIHLTGRESGRSYFVAYSITSGGLMLVDYADTFNNAVRGGFQGVPVASCTVHTMPYLKMTQTRAMAYIDSLRTVK